MMKAINKFTFGRPKQLIRPTFWLFLENIITVIPAIGIYFAIQIIGSDFDDPNRIDISGLWRLAGIMGVLVLIQFLTSLSTFLNTYLPGTIHSAENKTSFLKKLRNLPMGYFLKKESGELVNTFTKDFLAIEQDMVGLLTGIISVIFSCIVTGIFMFWFNPKMALAFYICIPISVAIIVFSMRLTSKLTKRNMKASEQTATYLSEYMLGMKTLKSYNQTGKEFTKLREAYENLRNVNMRGEIVGGSLMSLANGFVKMGLPLMCFTGSYMMLEGELSVVDYLSLMVIGTKIISPVLTWMRYIVLLKAHYESASRIDRVMTQPEMSGDAELPKDGDIYFENVSFKYDYNLNNDVLKSINIVIRKNELTAIVGPSGSGKSTLLRLIARFWDADSGSIKYNGKPLSDMDTDKWMSNVSMVMQEVYLFHDTIRENIMFGREDSSEEDMISASKRAGCHEFIMKLKEGYDTMVGEGGCTLSGGEKQRISIARAMLKDAHILLLDEPTSGLDAENEKLVQSAISELVKGRTVIMIAHRLKTVRNAKQIIVIEKGEISESGTHEELLSNGGTYKRMWYLQEESLKFKL